MDTERIRPANRLNTFRTEQGIEEQFLVCYAGTMGYAQDLSPILAAAKKLRDHKNILFFLVGEGVRAAEWSRAAKDLPNVRYLPLLSEAEYTSLVDACDIGLVPLAGELRTPVVPAKLLDFMAAARPVIATVNRDSDTANIISTARCGFSFSPRDPAALADAILFLHGNRDEATALGNNGRKYAEDFFSLQKCSASYENLFFDLLNGLPVACMDNNHSTASVPTRIS